MWEPQWGTTHVHEVPEGFERYYPDRVCLLLLKTNLLTQQAARTFWQEPTKALIDIF